jgi:2-hydroxychromene-2-carboxylate isomerase
MAGRKASTASDELFPIRLFYAFRSPYCYLATERALALERAFRVELLWRLLYPARGSHESKMDSEEVAYMRRDVMRCAEAQGLELRLPDNIIQGRLAALGAEHALREGRGREFILQAARAYWVEGQDIDDARVLLEVAEAAGLEKAGFVSALTDRRLEAALRSYRQEARSLGVFGVPTFVIDGELFWGNDRYEFVVKELARRGLAR